MAPAVILVVDGDSVHRETLAGFLREAGYEVLTSADALSGWRSFQARRPDLVVLDLLLSEVSGVDLCERIARHEEGAARVPVLFMSDFIKQADWMIESRKSEGISRTLSKPVSRKELLAALSILKGARPPLAPAYELPAPKPSVPEPPISEPPVPEQPVSELPNPAAEKTVSATSPEAPRETTAAEDNIVAFPEPGRRSGPRRLLLADDNPVTRQLVRRAFGGADFQVDVAADGREAAGLLDGAPPDIALLDINLPGRNGFELFDVIRRNPALAGTAVVFLREPYEKIDENKLAACPADGLIQKPLKSSEWVQRIKDILVKKNRRSSFP